MRILHIVPSFYPATYYGGPMVALYGLCNALAGRGVELRVLTTDTAGPGRRLPVADFPTLTPLGYPVYFCKRLFFTSVSPALLRNLVRQIQWAEVVHLTAVYSFPVIPTLWVCRVLHKPVVWSPRGSLQRWQGTTWPKLKAVWERICQLILPERVVFHVTSNEEARESLKRFPAVKSRVIPNGVEVPNKVNHANKNHGLRLLYLGRLHPKKGIENLLVALANINGSLQGELGLKLAGTGGERYTKKLALRIHELGLSQQVEMAGEVSGERKERLFENTDVVILPSHTENFGMVVAEALAHGVPVIASRGTPWQQVEEVGCGLWAENHPESLAKAIEKISRMPLHEMGRRGREWMKRDFSWNDRAIEMIHLYSRLIEEDR